MGRGRSKGKRGKGKSSRAIAFWPLVLLGLLSLLVAGAATAVRITESQLPEVMSFEEYAESVPKVSRILASDGQVVGEFFTERRTIMWPDSIPPLLEKAILAAEDADFYKHEGISYLGILRAMIVNLWRGRITQGGSTITQQVVKQVFLSSEKTVERKFREMLMARLVEQKLTKKEILAMYASEVYLGHGRYGFEEASRFYFGKPAKDLNLAEAAMLAGLTQAPSALDPIDHPEEARQRQKYVLRRMVEEGWVKEEDARAAMNEPIEIWGQEERRLGAAPYFVDAVRREVLRLLGEGRLLHDGLTIKTTLDLQVSDALEKAIREGLKDLYKRGRTRERDERAQVPEGDEEEEPLPEPPKVRYGVIAGTNKGEGLIPMKVDGKEVMLDTRSLARMGEEATVREGQTLPVSFSGRFASEDKPIVNAELGPQVAAAVVEPVGRGVLALVGGEDFQTRPFNRAVQSRRPIGSLVKPFLYAKAIEEGMSPERTFPNTPLHLRGKGGRTWSPRNYEIGYDGREYDMASALALSINVIAVRAMMEVGPGPVARLLRSLGLEGHIPEDLSLALGSAEATPLEMANAFATFAADGLFDTPYLISGIYDHKQRPLLEHRPRPSRRISKETARLIRGMMRRVVTEGTAKALASIPSPIFGKTGTTNRSREAWFVGCNTDLCASFLVGYDDRLPMPLATGGNTAVPFFGRFFMNLRATPLDGPQRP